MKHIELTEDRLCDKCTISQGENGALFHCICKRAKSSIDIGVDEYCTTADEQACELRKEYHR